MSQPTSDPVFAALAAEHAAIYGYGMLGAHLNKGHRALARRAEAAHRNRRDAVALYLAESGATPPAAEPAYTLPAPVTNDTSAVVLAIALEDATARSWRAALGATGSDLREIALSALIDSAVAATRWRAAAGANVTVVPFPGSPI